MRVKKQKRHRRAVRFYTVCHGFRQPFKVLCDGTFVHHLIANRIAPADTALSNILGAPVKLFTTRCVLEELKRLGKSYTESLEAAQQLMVARCDHEKLKTADACISEIIGEKNQEHFFVATQDTDLRKKLQELPAVPLVFGLRNALFLEPPSKFQRQFAKSSEEQRLHMTDLEKQLLRKRTNNPVEDQEPEDPSQENAPSGDENENLQPQPRKHPVRKSLGVKDRPQFKRKKAKNPNPLSIKKKKNRQTSQTASKEDKGAGDDTARSRTRKRKRSRKSKKLPETSS
ncbi:hypothetical protein Tsubulata_001835 [Turnera subulata]|uniref:UTP23 sensor motif region domain-containing protein n=1 Tax=Turnera subulata TaxID=218843 RepID=A0A9Q0G2N9_9ROSI|nr:hypothetical protein Tsubulata_001835 [Turnera subulata]